MGSFNGLQSVVWCELVVKRVESRLLQVLLLLDFRRTTKTVLLPPHVVELVEPERDGLSVPAGGELQRVVDLPVLVVGRFPCGRVCGRIIIRMISMRTAPTARRI